MEKLREENEELKKRCEVYKKDCEFLKGRISALEKLKENDYMRGRIDGLEFSIRCNGVCGDSVKHA